MRTWSRTQSRTSVRTFDRAESGLPPVAGDPSFYATTLLLSGNGTNGAQNNTFVDGSTNNFTITRNGNTTQGTFSPFSQTGWGAYFDGSGDFLGIADNAALDIPGDFTIEFWANVDSGNVNLSGIIGHRDQSTFIDGTDWVIRVETSVGKIGFAYSSLGNYYDMGSYVVGEWAHYAITRAGTTIRTFKNGTQVATAINSGTWSSGAAFYIGRNISGYDYKGFLSNVRLVKGTAVYTSNFTPSTTPLTAIANTSLLTCQSNRFVDNSTNAFAITANGNVSVQAFSPFNPTAAWSAATNGGSGYFDGSGDYLTTASSTSLALGSGDFTVDVWFYPTTTNTYFPIDFRTGCTLYFYVTSGTTVNVAIGGNSETTFTGVVTNAWNHFACVRSGSGSNNVSYYLNGVRGAQQTDTTNFSSATTITLGKRYTAFSGNEFYLAGYLGSTRLVVGTAVYSGATYTVPTAPLTAITNTSLLLNFTNAGIYDATSKNDLETVGNAQISTTQSKFGGSSMYFDGTGDYLVAADNAVLELGGGDWTLECWYYQTVTQTYSALIGKSGTAAQFASYLLQVNSLTPTFYLSTTGSSYAVTITSSIAITNDAWHHLSVVRSGNTITLYVNGASGGSAAYSSTPYDGSYSFVVGAYGDGSYPINGYVQDVRITKGIARYTTGFTPPTAAFPVL